MVLIFRLVVSVGYRNKNALIIKSLESFLDIFEIMEKRRKFPDTPLAQNGVCYVQVHHSFRFCGIN